MTIIYGSGVFSSLLHISKCEVAPLKPTFFSTDRCDKCFPFSPKTDLESPTEWEIEKFKVANPSLLSPCQLPHGLVHAVVSPRGQDVVMDRVRTIP